MAELLVGLSGADHVRIEIVARTHPDAGDYWDANWVSARVSIRVGGFRGKYHACLTTYELKRFRDELAIAYDHLDGTATFESMEEWLCIRATGDGVGHFALSCRAKDAPGTGNELQFHLDVDQSQLLEMVWQLDEVLAQYPVVGAP